MRNILDANMTHKLFFRDYILSLTPRPLLVRLIGLFVLGVFLIIFTVPTYAQNAGSVVLQNTHISTFIAPNSYITLDESHKLDLETLIERHSNNLRGVKQTSLYIHPEIKDAPMWMVFSVRNQTDQEDWFLDFGRVLDGRMGVIKNIYVLNYSTGEIFSHLPFENSSKTENDLSFRGPQQLFLGSALEIKIKPKANNLFVAYIETSGGFPLTLKPQLISKHSYLKSLVLGDVQDAMANLLAVFVLVFFGALFFIRHNRNTILYLAYYSTVFIIYFLMNTVFVTSFFGFSSLLLILYSISLTLCIAFTWQFLGIRYDNRPAETYVFYVMYAVLALSTILYVFLIPQSQTGFLIYAICICIIFALLVALAAFLGGIKKKCVLLFCLGLLITLLSFFFLCCTPFGIFSSLGFGPELFWIAFIPQAICFVLAHLSLAKDEDALKEQEYLRLKHEEKSLARLQKSKESADQARLMRIIERERELMGELREREVQRTEEMRRAKDLADRANQAKSAFLAVVSHEIRTPMTGIMGMVQLLQNTDLSKSQKDYIETIKSSGDALMALLNDILDFEKIERGGMLLENIAFDLPKLVQSIVTLMSGHASQKGLYLRCNIEENIPQSLMGDPTRMRQVLLNLVNNGLKFTENGGVTIEVSVLPTEREQKVIHFAVHDTGIGISEEAQAKLFTPFTQAEASTTRKYGGTGLGLAICDKLIEAMGGKIQVQSQHGSGSKFYFDIPFAPVKQEAHEAEALTDHIENDLITTPPMRILVVEDNEMNRKVLEGLLIQKKHTVFLAANGMEALQVCRREKPELIFMDIQMNGMNGLETTQKLRQDLDLSIARIPVIALTGNVMLDDIETYFKAQMNGFVAKPITPEALYKTIHNASKGRFENPLPDSFREDDALAHVPHDLALDSREDFTGPEPSALLQKSEDPFLSMKTELEFDHKAADSPEDIKTVEHENTRPSPKENSADVSSQKEEASSTSRQKDELTEIQKYLLAQSDKSNAHERETSEPGPISTMSQTSSGLDFMNEELSEDELKEDTFAQALHAQDDISQEDIHETAAHAPQASVPSAVLDIDSLLDVKMLEDLSSTLGKDTFSELLDGFVEKADEIVRAMQQIALQKNITLLGARAHELKGMTSNFGMIGVSDCARIIETAAKTGQNEEALQQTAALPNLNTQTKDALRSWLSQN